MMFADCYSVVMFDGFLFELHHLPEHHTQLGTYSDHVWQSKGVHHHHLTPFFSNVVYDFCSPYDELEYVTNICICGLGDQDLGTVLIGWIWFGGLPFDWVRLILSFLPLAFSHR